MKNILSLDFSIDIKSLIKYKFFFIGVLGSGMSSLATYLLKKNVVVNGSDRSYNPTNLSELTVRLKELGSKIYKQNGLYIDETYDFIVISSAIERDNLDIQRALKLNIPIIHRTDLLSKIFNSKFGISVAGTSGKSSTTGILGFLLNECGYCSDIINGAGIIGIEKSMSNCYVSNNNLKNAIVIETDESDGSLVKFNPEVGILSSISKDHKTIEELLILFQAFINNVSDMLIINSDDKYIRRLELPEKIIRVGQNEESDYKINNVFINQSSSSFLLNDIEFQINIPGLFNVYNASFAIAAALYLGIDIKIIQKALPEFRGIKNRCEFFLKEPISLILDYAHNPEKIKSLLNYLNNFYDKYLLIYQPHGFAPTFFTKNELLKVIEKEICDESRMFLLPIYYAGGTVNRKITSEEICQSLKKNNVRYAENRELILDYIKLNKNRFDAIVLAGARDLTLRKFIKSIKEIL